MIPGIGRATANRIYESIAMSEPPASGGGLTLTSGSVGDDESSLTINASPSITRDLSHVSPKLRQSKLWQEFIRLLELLVADENRNRPAKQIELILTNGYEQYLQENYENAEARAEDIRGLALYANRYNSTEDFLSELALLSTERFKEPQPLAGEDVISGGEEDELLTLTSVHQAKGLEWKAVFLIWAAEGKFPSPRSLKEIDSEEEERRLWYVALTRAKDELYICYPLMITDYSRQTVLQKPSRFVTECPPALFEIWNLEEGSASETDEKALAAGRETEYLN
jgi:DNA helicase-2/ATP-dependent DNA helicase PcrA